MLKEYVRGPPRGHRSAANRGSTSGHADELVPPFARQVAREPAHERGPGTPDRTFRDAPFIRAAPKFNGTPPRMPPVREGSAIDLPGRMRRPAWRVPSVLR